MTAAQAERIERSLGDLTGEVRALATTLTTNVAKCDSCRRIVQGNGGKPIDRRVTTLETAREVTKGMILGMAMAVGAVSSAIGAIVAVTCS